ncbi:phosphoenolpyruvate--protein phosphotransferase [Rhodococcus wratislaviensis]|uniref:Phosphoenolpyruvate-protein phosphotransferase n=1 Tax=Rhodococcus wratislaviensis TaxID=44752 RepID=A0AB38F7L1_RHOWR|nr:phosphoenolpyruvate--protein phosphotransferase [Rhodococcus wratislaviensis]REE76654.1 phosphoenolpyruvate--protein phosphotransferase [Rhodococcus wratislaviensis]SPZ35907.1 phosphoenolpyruvate--protein phosphotransferase [Rhodococcus wratislaviensis]
MSTATEVLVHGLGVSPGLVCAPWLAFGTPVATSAEDPVGESVTAELARVRDALATVSGDLEARAAQVDGVASEILLVSASMARDPGIVSAAEENLRAGMPTAHAVSVAFAGYCVKLEALGGYLAERVADLRDLGNRAVAVLLGVPMPGIPDPGHPFVLVARDLSPADTAMLGGSDVVGLLTAEGGPTSHTAILAKSLGLPAIVNCAELDRLVEGRPVVLDGTTGEIVVDPSDLRQAEVAEQITEARARVEGSRGPGRTRDWAPVGLLVNIGTVDDAARAAAADSEGVGLFRTEFLYLGRQIAPALDEQIATYTSVLEQFAGRKVVVRTLDSGSDKPLPFLDLGAEENPALGVRGLRVGAVYPDVLATQLEALGAAAAATGADLWVMAPMVATAEEAEGFAALARARGIAKVGAMIEIPSAALRARDLLEHLDFVSIGTNDLSQYTCAVDRMAGSLAPLLDPWQPAVLDLIGLVGAAGTEAGAPVGVCGEAASDPALAPVLVGLGVTSLSMVAPSLGAVRARLAATDLGLCREMAAAARGARSPQAGRSAVAALAPGALR